MPAQDQKFLVVIAGPTAAGKTALAVDLAASFNSVILSADSRQFYREMNIGTAKPSEAELNKVKHYFISNKSVEDLFGAGHYEKEALALLDALFQTHRSVFLVGGSGLYIDALLKGVDDFADVPQDYRTDLNTEFAEKGLPFLQEELKQKDPQYFMQVDLQNPQRLIRALEVIRFTGKPYSSFLGQKKTTRHFSVLKIFLDPPRDELYTRINARVDAMMQKGLLDEVRSLKVHKHLNALKTVGYTELNDYLDGISDLNTAVDKIKQHTRNYAKRQITWFRKDPEYKHFTGDNPEIIRVYIEECTGSKTN
ncbi:MAG TPA: tRNA (adenosine(37)-N6)-dimethylallyltransferase MiaA [Bacteroidia bacterium]|nr:tRNA (adenosine(37)-N6)-dimethylallyltransferase MiaA [Bacteroidia bacterium]